MSIRFQMLLAQPEAQQGVVVLLDVAAASLPVNSQQHGRSGKMQQIKAGFRPLLLTQKPAKTHRTCCPLPFWANLTAIAATTVVWRTVGPTATGESVPRHTSTPAQRLPAWGGRRVLLKSCSLVVHQSCRPINAQHQHNVKRATMATTVITFGGAA